MILDLVGWKKAGTKKDMTQGAGSGTPQPGPDGNTDSQSPGGSINSAEHSAEPALNQSAPNSVELPGCGSGGKVLKTLIDQPINSALIASTGIQPNSASEAASQGTAASESVSSRTFKSEPDSEPAETESQSQPKRAPRVMKTMLDHAILRDTVAKAASELEIKVAEQLKERANEPVKPFVAIEKFKLATPCAAVWDKSADGERFQYCAQCRLHVYDFGGIELPDAEELIFRRENRKNAPLFKRADGKFLTSDCPIAAKRKQTLLFAKVGGVLLVLCVLALLLLLPKQTPNTAEDDRFSQSTSFAESRVDSGASKGQSPTVQPQAPAVQAVAPFTFQPTKDAAAGSKSSLEPGQSEKYWESQSGE